MVLDTTPLPVKVLDDVFAEPISVDLTLALDGFTHSLVAFRLTPGSDSSVEVAMLLRDVMLPLPMRPGWGPEMEWPYPGAPAALVAEFAGHPVAGRPFFTPDTVTSRPATTPSDTNKPWSSSPIQSPQTRTLSTTTAGEAT
ncbi:hypothetical protein ACFW1M_33365 [Streptomyces inhibens]|uniref:hypothetical protein n=1 Tax=Streptomyces inhibens TaxID=2293571 RepID=UPI00367FFB2A